METVDIGIMTDESVEHNRKTLLSLIFDNSAKVAQWKRGIFSMINAGTIGHSYVQK